MSPTQGYRLFVGVDIAAVSATAAWMEPSGRPTRAITVPQTGAGYSDLKQRLLATGHPASAILVVMEATGSYWITLATTLAEVGFAISVINPTQANNFAKALLKDGDLYRDRNDSSVPGNRSGCERTDNAAILCHP